MKRYTLLICFLWVGFSCQSNKQKSPDVSAEISTGTYKIVSFDLLPKDKQQMMMDSFFFPRLKGIHSLLTKPVSIAEAQGFVKTYSGLINNKFLKEVPGSPDTLASISLEKIIHNNTCIKCDASSPNYPSYAVDIDTLNKYVIKSRKDYPAVKYLRLYPAIKKEGSGRVYTLVLIGLDKKGKSILRKGAKPTDSNFIVEYIDPCNPKCPIVGEDQ